MTAENDQLTALVSELKSMTVDLDASEANAFQPVIEIINRYDDSIVRTACLKLFGSNAIATEMIFIVGIVTQSLALVRDAMNRPQSPVLAFEGRARDLMLLYKSKVQRAVMEDGDEFLVPTSVPGWRY
ncbi:MAG: hypothetical protein HOO67_01255 [Candidatus Peribacteraceae bacterium]|nr:hypothetical protein [Candidatus Peribacteraceae bacterium]